MSFAERACIAVRYGVPVMPLLPRLKKPFLDDWQHLATTDPTQIAQWDKENPNYNCGAVGRTGGFWILDVDAPNLLARIERETGHSLDELDTLVVKSSGEKRHFYFKHDSRSDAMENFGDDDKDGEVFSVRAHNAYAFRQAAFVPRRVSRMKSSLNPHGAKSLRLLVGSWIGSWLRNGLVHRRAPKMHETISLHARNKMLTSLAGVMRRKGSNEAEILAALRPTNLRCEIPLSDAELMTIAGSIAKYPPAGLDELKPKSAFEVSGGN